MSGDRPNPDIFWTDEEVAELKAKGIIDGGKIELPAGKKCAICGEILEDGETIICDLCISF